MSLGVVVQKASQTYPTICIYHHDTILVAFAAHLLLEIFTILCEKSWPNNGEECMILFSISCRYALGVYILLSYKAIYI